jgi:hypothetical protein
MNGKLFLSSIRNTIHQIAKATSKNDIEIRKIIFSFIQAGLDELVRPEGAPLPPIQTRIVPPQVSKTEQKSLIFRIISRIRSL